ncbi:uncharacterized protein LOC113211221 [Frankliniella occidentalis]|uniref:Uncharacterized protein LOC113211221 n=1 Tax=Frankliniella occidentalis TaxID=133901 RepID=A0A6J1T3U6_FRAOC|nr:uncharacterized protein LOC113211221 [Frankliniella occidentalis]XP_052120669.1 uncharacterized protein LOC113211221 [Frankliniella occidentalis]
MSSFGAQHRHPTWTTPYQRYQYRPVRIRKIPIRDYSRYPIYPGQPNLIDLPRGSEGYWNIAQLWEQYKGENVNKYSIRTIQTICNSDIYEEFYAVKEEYELCKPRAEVYTLLHGTKASNVDGVVRNNLRREYIDLAEENRNSQFYCGDGFYFTQSAPYALKFSEPDDMGYKFVFVFDVLVGDMYAPPQNTPREHIPRLLPQWEQCEVLQRYHSEIFRPSRTKLPVSMRFDTTRPARKRVESFVKFQEAEFYPTHLITLEPVERRAMETSSNTLNFHDRYSSASHYGRYSQRY